MSSRDFHSRRGLIAGVAAAAAATAGVALLVAPHGADAFIVQRLVADPGSAALEHDAALVNAWGLAAARRSISR